LYCKHQYIVGSQINGIPVAALVAFATRTAAGMALSMHIISAIFFFYYKKFNLNLVFLFHKAMKKGIGQNDQP